MDYGLIGEKLTYSFSKAIHEQLAGYKYSLCPLSREEFDIFMKKADFKAINVTIPYKEDVIKHLYKLDENAEKIGAVNTIVNRDGKLFGYNTDFSGFIYMLKRNNVEVSGRKVIVLGRGGASKAVIAALKALNAAEIHTVYYKEAPSCISYNECYKKHSDADIIVNTTPVGMLSKENKSPVDIHKFNRLEAVVDIIYNPLKTKMMLMAENRGVKAINGLEMLVAQAKYAAELFTGSSLSDCSIDEICRHMLLEKTNLVLIGMPSSGKTTLGRRIAKILGKEFIDTDDKIVKKINMPISEYFSKYGEESFRDIESSVCAELFPENGLVIATGGGIIKREQNMEYLMANGRVIFINRNLSELSIDSSRPLSSGRDALKKMYDERLPLYKKYSESSINNKMNFQHTMEDIIKEYYRLLGYHI